MTKPLSRVMHGVLTDYPYVATVSSAPVLFDFEDEETAASLCRVFAGAVLVSTIFTRAEWGWVRAMPYRTHLRIDFLSGALALVAPWLFGFSQNEKARKTFLVMGLLGLANGALLSQPDESDPS